MNKRKKQKKLYKRKFHGFRFATLILVVLAAVELIVGTAGVFAIKQLLEDKPTLNIDDFMTQESSLVYDKNGTLIADVGTTLRENITYDQIPEAMIDAFLAIEDSRYFTHNGFDIPRFAKAALENLSSSSMSQGGSTFTMQLVKLTYFVNDDTGVSKARNIEYKVQQIALAIELEKQATKEEIFEMYLNKMNFGGTGNIRGVQKASKQYFGKEVSELTLSECALLAGVVNSPYWYDPHNYLDKATTRRDEVINLMVLHGYITEEEAELAKSIKVEDQLIDPSTAVENTTTYQYQAYIDTAIKEAEEKTGNDPLNVAMEIYTAMDPEVQDAMEMIAADGLDDFDWPDDLMEVAILSLNNQTGEIVGLCGGRNYAKGGSMLLNHATEQFQQPGSSVKPILAYALAFEYLGWATDHVITDKPVADGDIVFRNANGVYHGDVTLQYAVALSLNTPALQALRDVLNAVGYTTVTDYLMSLGFTNFTADDFNIQYAIGGSSFTVSAKELAGAHAIIMNGGYYIEPHTVTRIVYRSGQFDDYVASTEGTKVLSEQTCYLMSTLLRYNVTSALDGYYRPLQKNYPTYGKTGTSDWGESGVDYGIPKYARKDKWMIAETTQYTTAVWVGYEKAIAGENTYIDDAKSNLNIPGKINSYILDVLTGDDYPEEVAKPDSGISSITHILAVYPYVTPIAGMPSEYITTGLVKSEFATLSAPASLDDLESIDAFSADVDEDGNIYITWGVYPDETKLEVASTTQDISLYDSSGKLMAAATGTRMFDYSWITGAVRYKARLIYNGSNVEEITSELNEYTRYYADDLVGGAEYQVCGYYAYEISGAASNEKCVSITMPEFYVTVPFFYSASIDDYADINSWASQYDIDSVYTSTNPDSAEAAGIESGTWILYDLFKNQLSGTTYAKKSLSGMKVLAVYYE